ncbi:MAG: sugar transferase [Firmicutes bacterium]|nr:sugar transferase [Bacillota bacterium]
MPEYIRVVKCITPSELIESGTVSPGALVFVDSDVSGLERQKILEWSVRHGVEVYLYPSVYDVLLAGAHLTKLGDRPLLSVRPPAVQLEYQLLKRLFDVSVALVLLVIFAPLFLIIPIAIRLDSAGPIFYRQERVGQGGRRFTILKFRTMVKDAERFTGPVWACQNDPRVTRVGRILRATRLDELPQLLNILKGDMSLVGPRPERPVFVEEFAKQNPHFRLRELVKPGLTGLAQVMGRYNTSPEDKLRYDLLYIGKYSPWLDFRILLWTIQVVLFPQLWTNSPPPGVRQWRHARELRG